MRPDTETTGDEGVTLVELLVYSLLLVLVMSTVGGVLISTLTTENTVRTVTSASTSAQLVADSVTTGVRNSSAFRITAPSGSDQFVVARVAQGGSTLTWGCAAWYYSAAQDELRYTSSGTAITSPNSTSLATWTLLASDVIPASGSNVIFASTGSRLTLSFEVLASNSQPALVSTSAVSRSGSTESAPCF